uniref:BZIP domain-containing protein n=2 Tax=Meloidogyne TaxID=189290 RepID=A0A914KIZ8_MELIC
MQSRIEMICEDVNQLCNNNSTMLTTAPTAPEPKLTRTMIICEDVNRNDKDDNNDADNPLADHNLLLQEATPPDDQEGTLNMNKEYQHSLFCAPASPERSPSVLEQKPRVWRQQLGVPQRGFGSGNRADWDSSNRPVRLPRLVRRGVGGLMWRQTCGGTTNSTTTFTGRPKCIFKCDASNPKSSIYPDMPCLMCYEMRGYYGSGGGGGDDEYYGGGGSEFDELRGEGDLISSQPPRLLPAPECADIFTSRGFIAAPQSQTRRPSLENYQNYHQSQSYHQNYQHQQLENVNVATTSTNASGHASSGDFFNSHNCYYNNCNNTCYNNECFGGDGGGGNCLENYFENYYNHHLSSSSEQYHQNNLNFKNSFNNSFNNNHNNNYNQQQQQQNFSSNNYLSSTSPQQYLASTTTTPSSFSQNNKSDWHFWIDDLIKQVQNEVAAEKKLFCMDRRPSTTFSDISGNVGSVQQQNVFDDDEKVVNNNCATRFESGSVVSPSLYSQSSSGCSSSSSIGNSPYSFNGTIIPSSTTQKQKQPILSKSDILSNNNNNKLNKRAKKNSLLTLSREELAERKKQQNRVAAQRYRNRRTRTLESEKCEIDELESRNFKMREELAMLAKEIEKLRGQLLLSH